MSSAKLPLTKDAAAAAGPYVARIFFRSLLSFLAVDIVVMLCFDGQLWQWAVLTGVEALFLMFNVWRSNKAVREVLAPLGTLVEAAETLKDSSLDANELRRLARKLERQERFHLAGEEYKRSKGECSPVLKSWINRKNITICTSQDPDERMTTPELKEDILEGFRWLMPYYRYFKELELEPPVTDRF